MRTMGVRGRRLGVRSGALLATCAVSVLGFFALTRPTDSAPLAVAASKAAAVAAIAEETSVLGAEQDRLDRLFTGRALDSERAYRAQVRGLIDQGADYPGSATVSGVQVLSVSGDYINTMNVDLQAHVRLANMLRGAVIDYSESTFIYHVQVTRDGSVWRVSDWSHEFAPGFEP